MVRKDELERKVVEIEFPNAEKTFQYGFTSLISGTLRKIRPLKAEQVYVTGRDNLRDRGHPDGRPLNAPLLFLVGHESYWDFIDLPPEWSTLPRKPMLNVVARENYIGFPPLDYIINQFFSSLTTTVKRTWTIKGLSEEEKRLVREYNDKQIDSLFDSENNKFDRAILPEASTQKNGAFRKMHSGAWRAPHRVYNDKLEILNCVPIGNTFDNMSSIPGKHLTYINIGNIFQYYPEEYLGGENEEEYTKRDIAKFARKIKEKFVELHTFTLGQFGGIGILKRVLNDENSSTRHQLYQEIINARDNLLFIKDKRPIYLDPAFENSQINARFDNFMENLFQKGYISYLNNGTFKIEKDKVMHVPDNKRYKKENPLRYIVNKLIDVSQERPEVTRVIKEVYGFDTKDYVIS